MASHKRQSLLIEMFYYLKNELPPGSKLFLVGTGDPLYTKYLKLLIRQLDLTQQVVLTGKITEADLKQFYSLADAFICVSEYEGFCLPVVEAMKNGVPVFYRPLTGVKETMAGAGVKLISQDPGAWADSVIHFLKDESLQASVYSSQTTRLKTLSKFQNKEQIQKIFWKMFLQKVSRTSTEKKIIYDAPFVI